MKIYKLWQEDVCGYDTYDSAVIVAEGINSTKRISIQNLSTRDLVSKTWMNNITKVHSTVWNLLEWLNNYSSQNQNIIKDIIEGGYVDEK